MQRTLIVLLMIVALASSVRAQPGTIDPTFNTMDRGDVPLGADSTVYAIALQQDGKILIGGHFTTYSGTSINRIARLNIDGTLDTSFDPGSGANGCVYSIQLLADGKLLVGGAFTLMNGRTKSGLARLNPDGTVDESFAPGSTGADGTVYCIAMRRNGNYILGGNFTNYDGVTRNGIVGITSSGGIDPSFDPGTGIEPRRFIKHISIGSDEKLLIVGTLVSYNGKARRGIARVDEHGRLDTTFDANVAEYSRFNSCVAQADGSVLACGFFLYTNSTRRYKLARLKKDGTLDPSFVAVEKETDGEVYGFATQSNGAIVIVGTFTTVAGKKTMGIARLTADGNIDTTFAASNGESGQSAYVLAIHSDRTIYVGGNFKHFNYRGNAGIVHLQANGPLDVTFQPEVRTGADGYINGIAVQKDKKVIIAGGLTEFNGVPNPGFTRLNYDGTVDDSFRPLPATHHYYMSTCSIDRNGKILIGGQFEDYGPQARKGIVRLNEDGSIDQSFFANFDSNYEVTTMINQDDGKILVGGRIGSYAGIPCNSLIRLNENGSLDRTFNFTSTTGPNILTLAMQNDGKIIVGGYFKSVQDVVTRGILRIHPNGQLDTSFHTGTGVGGGVRKCAIQSDGKIVIGGSFDSYNGYFSSNLARINSDGSFDSTYDTGSGVSNQIQLLVLQQDGKLIIGGDFSLYNGVRRQCISRINIDGSCDMTFDPGSGATYLAAMVFHSNDKLLLGGGFRGYNGTGKSKMARIHLGNTVSVPQHQLITEPSILLYPNPSDGMFTFAGESARSVKVVNILGEVVFARGNFPTHSVIDIRSEPSGVYCVMIQHETGEKRQLIVKK